MCWLWVRIRSSEQLLPAAVDAYIANGDLDAALTDFAASIHDKYSYLNVK